MLRTKSWKSSVKRSGGLRSWSAGGRRRDGELRMKRDRNCQHRRQLGVPLQEDQELDVEEDWEEERHPGTGKTTRRALEVRGVRE